ncbi:MAG: O-succinylhomoserine sulfhydrylase [Gammaproteobacteria bacterium]
MTLDRDNWGFDTRAVRGGQVRTSEGEQSEPIIASSSFVFDNAAQAAARFGGQECGNIYSRFTNPTVRVFEKRLAALEGGERCVATSSGMSAILATCMALLKMGDHIVSSHSIFGTTVGLFNNFLAKFGVMTSFVPLTDYAAWQAAIRSETRFLFLETPSNPLTEIADLAHLAALAHEKGLLLIVDNCFCTPALQRPFELGADLVIHSATKYIDGQGRCIGGAVIGPEALVGEGIFNFLRTGGPTMSPFNAWVFLKGLETLSIRMRAHSDNALRLAEALERHPAVERVYYPGLLSHPQHDLARRQQSGFGGIVSFVVRGGREAAWRLIDTTRVFSITANLGDTKSTITHPATTTHSRLTQEERIQARIGEGLIRISVGIEDSADLIRDLERGLAQV